MRKGPPPSPMWLHEMNSEKRWDALFLWLAIAFKFSTSSHIPLSGSLTQYNAFFPLIITLSLIPSFVAFLVAFLRALKENLFLDVHRDSKVDKVVMFGQFSWLKFEPQSSGRSACCLPHELWCGRCLLIFFTVWLLLFLGQSCWLMFFVLLIFSNEWREDVCFCSYCSRKTRVRRHVYEIMYSIPSIKMHCTLTTRGKGHLLIHSNL